MQNRDNSPTLPRHNIWLKRLSIKMHAWGKSFHRASAGLLHLLSGLAVERAAQVEAPPCGLKVDRTDTAGLPPPLRE